ncbi:MAG: hypothetical protein WC858_01080 [Parcubacteria group bacterium]|jgi:hypothetical protein
MNESNTLKNFISQAILAGAILALVGFAYSMFLTKKWDVTGKIVIVPAITSPTAAANLFLESANTAEIVKGQSFQKNILGNLAANFHSAEAVKNSSTVKIVFRSNQADIQNIENKIVELPNDVASYTRDLYGGQPFKYLLIGDPEVSARPTEPNVALYAGIGFLAGLVLFTLYWILFGIAGAAQEIEPEETIEPTKERIKSPSFAHEEEAEILEEMPMIRPEMPYTPETERRYEEIVKPATQAARGGAPENLPIAEDITEKVENNQENFHEPTDDEVKDRLNRLMRGEL